MLGYFRASLRDSRLIMVSRLAAACHWEEAEVDAAADAALSAVAAAHVSAAFAGSVADGVVPSAVFLVRRPSAASCADVPGLVVAAAFGAPALASGTSSPGLSGISGQPLNFPPPAVCPGGLALANHWDERN